MTTTSLKFQQVTDDRLLMLLLAAICLVLLGWGVWQFVRRRWRYGAVCVASAFTPLVGGPVVAAALAVRYGRLSRRAAAGVWVAAGAVAAGLLVWALGGGGGIARGQWMLLLGLEVALAVGLFYVAVYAYLGTPRLLTLMTLRCIAIFALLTVLFRPAISRTIVPGGDDGAPYVPIVIDRSASMGTHDVGDSLHGGVAQGKPTRYAYALSQIAPALPELRKRCRVVWYHFASTAALADSLETLRGFRPEGEDTWQTELAEAIRTVRQNHSPDRLAAIVLVSDGVNNPRRLADDDMEVLSAAQRAGVPIHTAAVGSPKGPDTPEGKNLRIESVVVAPPVVIKNNVANVTVRVKISGYPRSSVKVRLFEGDDEREADSKEIWTHKDSAELEAKLKWTPRTRPAEEGGAAGAGAPADVRRLRVAIAAKPDERDARDNEAEVHALVTQPQIRLLYIEGMMRAEYKFLRQLLKTDPNVEFMSLVRMRGAQFSASMNLAEQGVAGLPSRQDNYKLLKMIDVLILGDLDRTFLNAELMGRIRQFVNDGGGLLMIGGTHNFGPGGYGDTDIESAMPVVVGSRRQPQEFEPFLPRLTVLGQRHPVLEGLEGYFIGPDGRAPSDELPALPKLRGCVTVVRAKPTADVLAVHPLRENADGRLVVLAVQQYGVGRSAAFTADTTWQWYMLSRGRGAEGPYERLWGQLVRWLAGADTKSRDAVASVVAQLEPSRTAFRVGEDLTAHALARGAKLATGAGAVTCTLVRADGTGLPRRMDMKALGEAGQFEASGAVREPGEYRLEVAAHDGEKNVIASDALPVVVTAVESEAKKAETDPARLRPDRDLLAKIAEASGGQHRDVAQFAALVRAIDEQQQRRAEEAGLRAEVLEFPRYDGEVLTILFVVFVALLTGEWLLRRSWQLH